MCATSKNIVYKKILPTMRFLLFLAFVLSGLVVSAVEPMGADVLMTRSLQQAIDSVASLPEGGVVRLDAGVYCTGTLRLKSGVRLHLERGATVLGSINPYD